MEFRAMDSRTVEESVPRRRYTRLRGYDYSSAGAYFVTICTRDRIPWFGDVVNGEMVLNKAGEIAERQWASVPRRFRGVELDAHVVMPNHVHGLIVLGQSPLRGADSQEALVPLWEVVRTFKAATSRLIRKAGEQSFGWQRGYHDRIVRDELELAKIREYSEGNAGLWELDRLNPNRSGRCWPKVIPTRDISVDRGPVAE